MASGVDAVRWSGQKYLSDEAPFAQWPQRRKGNESSGSLRWRILSGGKRMGHVQEVNILRNEHESVSGK